MSRAYAFPLALFFAMTLGAGGCRTSAPATASRVEAVRVGVEPVAPAPAAASRRGGSAPALPEDTAQPALLRGFDVAGATACLPLATDDHCYSRKDPVQEACGRIKGELSRCEDCSLICSKELPLRR